MEFEIFRIIPVTINMKVVLEAILSVLFVALFYVLVQLAVSIIREIIWWIRRGDGGRNKSRVLDEGLLPRTFIWSEWRVQDLSIV